MINFEKYNRQAMAAGVPTNTNKKDIEDFLDDCVDILKSNNVPSTEKRLERRTSAQKHGITYGEDDITTDYYYVSLINDVITQIRHGNKGYVFTLKQVKDLLRFIPDISVSFNSSDEIFEIVG